MRIIAAEASDFCCFKTLNVDLHSQGLVYVGGKNHDTDSAESNGSGKTTLFKAISWGLFGDTVDGKNGDEVIREGAKSAHVYITLQEPSSELWTIKRERRKAQPRLKLSGPDGDWEGSRAETQDKINELVGMDFTSFRNTVLYGQGERKRFTDPGTRDSDRKQMLHNILRTNVLRKCHDWVREQNLELKREAQDLEQRITVNRASLEEHDVEELQGEHDNFDENQAELASSLAEQARDFLAKAREAATKNDDAAELRTQADDRELKLPDLELMSDLVVKIEAARDSAQDDRNEWHSEAAFMMVTMATLDETLERLSGDQCPVCTSSLEEGAPADLITKTKRSRRMVAKALVAKQKAVKSALVRRDDEAQALAANQQAISDARGEIDEITELRQQAADLAAEAKQSEVFAAQAKSKATQAREAQEATNPYAKRLASTKKRVKDHKDTIKLTKRQLKEIAEDRAHYEFWMRGFSDQGLPSFILDSIMPYLTERANHHLNTLADGDITMSFGTQRELKSAKGEMRDEIDIAWEIEGKANHPPSGGQLKKMEIATDLALMDLVATREGSHIDLLMLDEVLDGLDKAGRRRVIDLLHELRKERGTILVISHDEGVADAFEKAVVVEMRDGISTLKAAA